MLKVEELMDSHIRKSKADLVILGGDFNTPPKTNPGEPYQIVQVSNQPKWLSFDIF